MSPQLVEHSQAMVGRQRITYGLLRDEGNRVAAQLGLRFTLPEELQAVYRSFGVDLALFNGEESWTLPMPGRLVIDTTGTIRAVEADPDYTIRPEPADTVRLVASL